MSASRDFQQTIHNNPYQRDSFTFLGSPYMFLKRVFPLLTFLSCKYVICRSSRYEGFNQTSPQGELRMNASIVNWVAVDEHRLSSYTIMSRKHFMY